MRRERSCRPAGRGCRAVTWPGTVRAFAGSCHDRGRHDHALHRAGAGLVLAPRARPAVARSRHHTLVGAGERDHAAADAGGAGGTRASELARPVAYAAGPRRRAGRRGDQAVGQARVPAARAAAARDGHHRDRAARRDRAGRHRRPAGTAGDRQLHRGGRGQFRLRPAARRARHQRPPGAGQAGGRPAPAAQRAVASGAADGRIAAARRAGGRGALVRRGDGAGRAGLHRGQPALRRLPGGPGLRLAGRRAPGARPGPGTGRRSRGRTQRYDGTDRQCRGRLLAVLRDGGAATRADFDAVWATGPSWPARWTGWSPTAWPSPSRTAATRCPAMSRQPEARACARRPGLQVSFLSRARRRCRRPGRWSRPWSC